MGLDPVTLKYLVEQHPNIKRIKMGDDEIEFHQPITKVQEVQAVTMPMTNHMPPDDVMLFASSEDVEELMDLRKA